MEYNVRVKHYPDGTKQYFFSKKCWQVGKEREEEFENTGENVERKESENAKRAVQMVYDYAKSNEFEWFITLTFDGSKVERYNYDACADEIKLFTQRLRDYGCTYLIVPEQHEDGAFHFHGLVHGNLPVAEAINPYTMKLVFDEKGRQIYNVSCYKVGHTTATRISDPARTATYLTKYLTKEISVPKGRKRYWVSRKLLLPTVEKCIMDYYEFGQYFKDARYQKVIDTEYGMYLLCET